MRETAFTFLFALAFFALAVYAIKTGQVRLRHGLRVRRAASPLAFWLFVARLFRRRHLPGGPGPPRFLTVPRFTWYLNGVRPAVKSARSLAATTGASVRIYAPPTGITQAQQYGWDLSQQQR